MKGGIMKVCSKCHKEKTRFYSKTNICVECSLDRDRIRYREKNPIFKKRGRQGSDLVGKKYGILTVVKRVENNKGKKAQWLCTCDCGNEKIAVTTELNRGRTKHCGCLRKECTGEYTGRKKEKGYVLLYRPKHPNARKDGWILEHVMIMSDKIGRPLKKDEHVHHKYGFKDDNRSENLELWTGKHPSGQRVKDIVDFCVNYLKEYKPEILAIT